MSEELPEGFRPKAAARLQITDEALQEVKAHAEESYPQECCGLLLSRDGDPAQIVGTLRARNSFGGPRGDRYSIDPLEFGSLERGAAERGLVVAGVYHSHPDYPAVLSNYDLARSFPWYAYVVVSVTEDKAGDIRCWVPDAGAAQLAEGTLEVGR